MSFGTCCLCVCLWFAVLSQRSCLRLEWFSRDGVSFGVLPRMAVERLYIRLIAQSVVSARLPCPARAHPVPPLRGLGSDCGLRA